MTFEKLNVGDVTIPIEKVGCKMLYSSSGDQPAWGNLKMNKKPNNRKTTPRLCCWIALFTVFFIILACPGLDPLDRKYESLRYAASFDRDEFDVCRGRRVFMYDLPSRFNIDVQRESVCNHSLIPWMDLCPRFTNGGYGLKLWKESTSRSRSSLSSSSTSRSVVIRRHVDEDDFDHSDWFDTDSYMLEMMFHSRLQKYRCLTNDSARADAFYVPYYTGLLALEYLYGEEGSYDKRKYFGKELLDWLEKKGGDRWKRFEGRDHFLIMGRTTWDFTLHENWGTDFSQLPFVSNMTNLMLERRTEMENEHAVPYPTSFHPESPERLQEWIENVKSTKRRYLFSYVGAPRPDSWSVRGIMGAACINAGQSICNLVNCSIVSCSHDPIPIYKSFLQSNFCLQPRGDTSTRRSTFDCLISGAIPVFFHRDTAYSQYAWHLPEDPDSYSVYIDEEDLKSGTKSIQSVLMSYSPERIRRMRRTIISLIPNLLYNGYENDHSTLPKDAFELSMEKLLQRISAIKREMVRSHRCWIPFIHRRCFFS